MIFRNRHSSNFTILSNDMINDKTLSFKARGLLVFMLSRPANWKFYSSEIESHSDRDGGTSISSGIKELIKAGYVSRTQTKNEAGQWEECAWDVWETPQAGKPHAVKPCPENRPLQSTEERVSTHITLPPALGGEIDRWNALAIFLSDIVSSKKNIKISAGKIKVWTTEMKKLETVDGVGFARARGVARWYKQHMGEEYVPVVESGSAFRDKFLRLEDAIKRDTKSRTPSVQDNTPLDPFGETFYTFLTKCLGVENTTRGFVCSHLAAVKGFWDTLPQSTRYYPGPHDGPYVMHGPRERITPDELCERWLLFLERKQDVGFTLRHPNDLKIGGSRWHEFVGDCEHYTGESFT